MPFDTSQLSAFARDLAATATRVRPQAEAAVAKVARDTAARAAAAAPVDTGALRASITAKTNGLDATITATADHAVFVEYGTSRMGPRPFLDPATTQAEVDLAAAVEKIAGSIL